MGKQRIIESDGDSSSESATDHSIDKMRGAYLGPSFDSDEIGAWLNTAGSPTKPCEAATEQSALPPR